MAGKKYFIYSKTKLEYIEVYKNERHKYLKNYPLIIIGFILCVFLFGVFSFYVDSPKVFKLRSEREVLMQEYGILKSEIAGFEKQMAVINSKDDSLYRKVLGMDPLPKSIRTAGFGGNASEKESINILDNPSYNLSDRLKRLQSKLLVLDKSMNQVVDASKKNISRMKHTPAIMPIYNKDLKGTGAGFGLRYHPILRIRRMHEGIDFYAKKGTEVFATADGVIKKAYCSRTFGNVIIVNHSFGMETYYAHLSEFNSKVGQRVRKEER